MSETVLAGRAPTLNSPTMLHTMRNLAMRHTSLFTVAVLLNACAGGQTGQEDKGPACAYESNALTLDEATDLGFSASDLKAALASSLTSSIHWSRMDTTDELTLEVQAVSAQRLKVSNKGANGGCPETVELDVTVAIHTADGLLNEQLEGTINAGSLDEWVLNAHVDMDAVEGTLDAATLDLDLSNWKDPQLTFRLQHTLQSANGEATLRGQVSLDGDDPNPDDSSSPVSAAIAELPAP